MLKFILSDVLLFVVALTIISQVIVPAFIPGLDFFWLFKKAAKPDPNESISSLDELDKEVDQTIKQYKTTKKKVDAVSSKVEKIKNKTN